MKRNDQAADSPTARTLLGAIASAAVLLVSAALQGIGSEAFENPPETGYAVLDVEEGSPVPRGAALFSFTNFEGDLVWETGAEAVLPLASGRIFVDQLDGMRTALALANLADKPSRVGLTIRDSSGMVLESEDLDFLPEEHRALFVDELFPDLPEGFVGSLTFRSGSMERNLGGITLRSSRNHLSEDIFSTFPVAELEPGAAALSPIEGREPENPQQAVFPHIGVGPGLATEIVLINREGAVLEGAIRLVGSEGSDLEVVVDGFARSEVPYRIEPDGVFRCRLSSADEVRSGYAIVGLDSGSRLPVGTALFQFRGPDGLISEAGVGAPLGTRFRLFADGNKKSVGVALASPGNPSNSASFRLLDPWGGELSAASKSLPADGHMAAFVDEIFPRTPDRLQGIVEVGCDEPCAVVSLKLSINQRLDPILTALPVTNLDRKLEGPRQIVFPHLGFGGGLATRLILLNPDLQKGSSGRLRFVRTEDGSPWELPLGGRPASEVDLLLFEGGVSVQRPGDTSPAATLLFDSLDPQVSGAAVAAGNSLQLQSGVLDSEGNLRLDFLPRFSSRSPEIASVDARGRLQGLQVGFATIDIEAAGSSIQGSIAVVNATPGSRQDGADGIVWDFRDRFYFSDPDQHVIRRVDALGETPTVFAGMPGQAGFDDGPRQRATFRQPSFMAWDQTSGDLYISDSGNHAIRVLHSGGEVETLAGTGQPGDADGPIETAQFRSPAGIVLDGRGNLWVADSDNHTLRRIDLVRMEVTTVAGLAGQAGFHDGAGGDARFRSPVGLAVESGILLGSFLNREFPESAVLVSDSGNGRLRRVFSDGRVETLIEADPPFAAARNRVRLQSPLRFDRPAALDVDALGNVYVTERGSGRVKVINTAGGILGLADIDSSCRSCGLVVLRIGQVVVGGVSATRFEMASPRLIGITPPRLSQDGGQEVRIQARGLDESASAIIGSQVIADNCPELDLVCFTSPPLDSNGRQTITVASMGGLAQDLVEVDNTPLDELPPGNIITVAGGTTFVGDGSRAELAIIGRPHGIAMDLDGNIFIADGGTVGTTDANNPRIRRIDKAHIITTIAGNGKSGFSGDGGLAVAAGLNRPTYLAVGPQGFLFINDSVNRRIRKVDLMSGIITTLAGNGELGDQGDGGPALMASFDNPTDLAVDRQGNLYIADSDNDRVRKVDVSGFISTYAGGGRPEDRLGDGLPAYMAELDSPRGLAIDREDNLFIADQTHNRIRRVDGRTRIITTVTTEADRPESLTVDLAGNLFWIRDNGQNIYKWDARTGEVSVFAGTEQGFGGDGGPAREALFAAPFDLLAIDENQLLISDQLNNRIRKIDESGNVSTVAGDGRSSFSGDGGLATAATLDLPQGGISFGSGIAIDRGDNLFIADTFRGVIRRVDSSTGIIETVAGSGRRGYSTDDEGGPATEAALNFPEAVAVDSEGNLFIADTQNGRIRRVDAVTGAIVTVAGGGGSGDGLATEVFLFSPTDVAVDGEGNLYIAEPSAHRIRKVDMQGQMTTVAGTGEEGSEGDGGTALQARFMFPQGIALDGDDILYIADTFNSRIRKVDLKTGIITTVAGTGEFGFDEDGIAADMARLGTPEGVAVDSLGNLYIADTYDILTAPASAGDTFRPRVFRVDAVTGVLSTVAGNGTRGFSGDRGPAIEAALDFPESVAVDSLGNIYISDAGNDRIRAVRNPGNPR